MAAVPSRPLTAGVSTREYAAVCEPVGAEVEREPRATGESTISELFVERTKIAVGVDGPLALGRAPGGGDARWDRHR